MEEIIDASELLTRAAIAQIPDGIMINLQTFAMTMRSPMSRSKLRRACP